MRFVQRADMAPQHCVAMPQVGQAQPLGYIDYGSVLPNGPNAGHVVQVSVVAMREAAREFPQVGLVSRDEHALVLAERDAIQKELEDLQAEVKELNRELEAVHVLERRSFTPKKKPGPKAKAN